MKEYLSKEILTASFPNGVKHYFYKFPNGRGAHVIYWPDKMPGFRNQHGKFPDVDYRDRNWDVGFQRVGNEPATRWQFGLSDKQMVDALKSTKSAPELDDEDESE